MAESAISLASSAERTGSGNGTPVDIQNLGATARLVLDVTAASVSADSFPLFFVVETGPTSSGPWEVAYPTAPPGKAQAGGATWGHGAAVHQERRVVPGLDRFVRARWTIQDGIRVTFSCTGHVI